MSKKIELLREVSAMITERCNKIETEIFLTNSNSTDNIVPKSSNSKIKR